MFKAAATLLVRLSCGKAPPPPPPAPFKLHSKCKQPFFSAKWLFSWATFTTLCFTFILTSESGTHHLAVDWTPPLCAALWNTTKTQCYQEAWDVSRVPPANHFVCCFIFLFYITLFYNVCLEPNYPIARKEFLRTTKLNSSFWTF